MTLPSDVLCGKERFLLSPIQFASEVDTVNHTYASRADPRFRLAAIAEGKKLGLANFDQLSSFDHKKVSECQSIISQECDLATRDPIALIGCAEEPSGSFWAFLPPSDENFEGAHAVYPSKDDSGHFDLENDLWEILAREPLLLRSMFGAVLGFAMSPEGAVCHVLYEGESGWF